MSGERHSPVMLNEVIAALNPRDGAIYVDSTLGAGGYSRGLLEAAECRVCAIGRLVQNRAFAINHREDQPS